MANCKEAIGRSLGEWTEQNALHCIKKLIKRGGSFDYVNEAGFDVVMKVVQERHENILLSLVSNFAQYVNPNTQNDEGNLSDNKKKQENYLKKK